MIFSGFAPPRGGFHPRMRFPGPGGPRPLYALRPGFNGEEVPPFFNHHMGRPRSWFFFCEIM